MNINVHLLQWFIILLIKNFDEAIQNEIISNKELAEDLRKPIIRKFEKIKVHASFIDNICGVDLADMQLISKFNKEFRFLLYVIDVYSKICMDYSFKRLLMLPITNASQKNLNESNRKPNKLKVDKGSKFYNK